MFQTKDVQKIKIHILRSITFFFFFLENRAVYEKMWKNMVLPDEQHMTIWRMRIARAILSTLHAVHPSCIENQITHFMFKNFIFRKSCRL